MSNFVTPQWDSSTYGDEMCSKLFKVNKQVPTKFKKKRHQMKTIQEDGRIVKSKLKHKAWKIKEKVKKALDTDVVNNLVNKSKAKLSKKQKASELQSSSKKLNGHTTKKSKNELRKQKRKTKLIQSLKGQLNDLPASKHLNIVKAKLKGKKDDEITNLLENANTSNLKVENRKLNNSKSAGEKKKLKSRKLENLKKDITSHMIPKRKKVLSLRERMMNKLKASRFRYLNEQIYSSESKDAQQMFVKDPESFLAYHEGYRQQVNKWPINPLDVIIGTIKKMPRSHVIADFGCGDAKLSQEVEQKVHSFDLVAANEKVTACDMSNVPLKKGSVDVIVFCLSLMGTNLHDYLKEANRVLKIDGLMKIAEVESRFDNVDSFIEGVEHFGFQNTLKDLSHNLFYFMDFKKTTNIKKTRILPTLSLHPCLYKKR